jgi:16S rRNA (guanine(966)-N(2))-methyltransferase RsmD
MRIIGGKFRGRRLQSARAQKLRPTSDRLRETLFDVIAAARAIEGTRWLDLYAGTGAIGLEALSRGAARVSLVESSRPAADLIRKNIAALGAEGSATIIQSQAMRGLQLLQSQGGDPFDFCFLDPPYDLKNEYAGVLQWLDTWDLMAPGCWAIAEHSKRFDLPDRSGSLERFRRLQQGDAVLSFFRRI